MENCRGRSKLAWLNWKKDCRSENEGALKKLCYVMVFCWQMYSITVFNKVLVYSPCLVFIKYLLNVNITMKNNNNLKDNVHK